MRRSNTSLFKPSRTIFYSIPKGERKFDFKTPCVDLTGSTSKHFFHTVSSPREQKIFRNIKVFPQPPSARTLNPSLSPESRNLGKKTFYHAPSIKTSYSFYRRTHSRKNNPKRNYSCIEFSPLITKKKERTLSPTQKYKNEADFNSQISTLPYGSKREGKDVERGVSPKTTTAYSIKINQLYKTKVNCLPGCEKIPKGLSCKNNYFLTSHVKGQNSKSRNKIFNTIHEQCVKTAYKYYRNRSQITIS